MKGSFQIKKVLMIRMIHIREEITTSMIMMGDMISMEGILSRRRSSKDDCNKSQRENDSL